MVTAWFNSGYSRRDGCSHHSARGFLLSTTHTRLFECAGYWRGMGSVSRYRRGLWQPVLLWRKASAWFPLYVCAPLRVGRHRQGQCSASRNRPGSINRFSSVDPCCVIVNRHEVVVFPPCIKPMRNYLLSPSRGSRAGSRNACGKRSACSDDARVSGKAPGQVLHCVSIYPRCWNI